MLAGAVRFGLRDRSLALPHGKLMGATSGCTCAQYRAHRTNRPAAGHLPSAVNGYRLISSSSDIPFEICQRSSRFDGAREARTRKMIRGSSNVGIQVAM
jgi:hypothetical protein